MEKVETAWKAAGDMRYHIPDILKRKLEAVRKRSYRPLVPEGTQPHDGRQEFILDELDGNIYNRYDVGSNFRPGNYVFQIDGEKVADLHDPKLANRCIRRPWWAYHVGSYSTKSRNKKHNYVYWHVGPRSSLFGPIIEESWSGDRKSVPSQGIKITNAEDCRRKQRCCLEL